ncbi:MAG: coenzyme F420 hydrogenase [Microgenomates group bacterium GW2011_GWC1_37_8]|nr:MAG: coenzyme F420 hydrogenase [Microgenomates group bacterium GW2011_GWC1_37_8]
MSAVNELKSILTGGLYNFSGTWEGLSEGKIKPPDKESDALPVIPEDLPENIAQRILKGSSDKEISFPQLNEFVFGKGAFRHPYLGHYKSIAVGFTVDNQIRQIGSSGGIVSSILIWLLKNRKINGAVVLGFDKSKPWLTKPFIARTPEQILSAAGSKYITGSVNQILSETASWTGPLAYVGLPHEVQSIRKLQQVRDPAVKTIKYVIGVYYGNSMNFSSVKSLLHSYGVYDYREIRHLSFRSGEWPGNTRIELKSGRIITLPKFYANYLIPFHIVKRSLLCTDLTNELTDISVGDAWAPVYEERGKGYSTVITRSKKGQEILNLMQKEKLISLNPVSLETAIRMHSHGFDLKKRGAFIRIAILKKLGRPVPDYGYVISGFSLFRYLMELVIDILFILCGTKFARSMVEKINPVIMGKLFMKFRLIWKQTTANIKKSHL